MLIPALRAAAAGVITSVIVNIFWLTVYGHQPSLSTLLIASQSLMIVWAMVEAARFRRKWRAVVASYERPALGEGIDIPNRPPLDDGPVG